MFKHFALMTILSLTHAFSFADNGSAGQMGKSGADGSNGYTQSNLLVSSDPAYKSYYFVLMNCDFNEALRLLNSDASINTNFHARGDVETAFHRALQYRCGDILQAMFQLPREKGPNLRISFRRENHTFSVYELLTFDGYIQDIVTGSTSKEVVDGIYFNQNQLRLLKQMLAIEDNGIALQVDTQKVIPALKRGKFASREENIEAVFLIEERIKQLNP